MGSVEVLRRFGKPVEGTLQNPFSSERGRVGVRVGASEARRERGRLFNIPMTCTCSCLCHIT